MVACSTKHQLIIAAHLDSLFITTLNAFSNPLKNTNQKKIPKIESTRIKVTSSEINYICLFQIDGDEYLSLCCDDDKVLIFDMRKFFSESDKLRPILIIELDN